jgi:esterase/lipase
LGVVLIHSYLAVPEEVRALAQFLRRRGVWVYAPRLPGHGTSAEDLATRKHEEWRETVENGFALLSTLCDRVAVGGMAVGGNLALDLASRVESLAGVFAVCPPYTLGDYSNSFMPANDVWNKLLNKMKKETRNIDFLEFSSDNLSINYPLNPVTGVKEVGDLLESLAKRYSAIRQPALIVQADRDPVVHPRGSRQLFDLLGSRDKEYCLLSYGRHVLVNGDNKERVFRKIGEFVDHISRRQGADSNGWG